MKKRKSLYVVLIFLVCVIMLKNNYILAEDDTDSFSEELVDAKLDEIEIKKKEILNMISECIKEMKTKIVFIETKEAKIKNQKEFENYPAIRLNIDTPVFGIISMVDNKLKIRKDVSTVDVANGYSIKDVVNKNKIKLSDFSVGSIVVTTRDVEIDENMTYEEASMTLLKIMQYMSQLDSADEFLDYQINRIFKGYIDKEKIDKINDIKTRNDKVTASLASLDKKLTLLSIIKNDEEKLKEVTKSYNEIVSKNKNINTSVKDVLMTSENLSKLQKDAIELEGKVVELTENIDSEVESAIDAVDEEKMLKSIKEDLVTRRDDVEKYIENAVSTNEEEEKEVNEEGTKNIVINYDVTSKNTLDVLNNYISSIDDKILKYVIVEENNKDENTKKTEDISQEIANKKEVTNIEVKELTKDEKKALVEEIYQVYVNFLTKENKFYLDNTNFLINDTTSKLSKLAGKTNKYVLSYMKYMYIELPTSLKSYVNSTNMSLKTDLNKLTENLKAELIKIVEVNENITKLYNKMIEEELKS